jgi:hypothetical protein
MLRKAALGFISVIITACSGSRARSDARAARPSAGPRLLDAMDRDTLAQLRQNGANLTKRTDMVHYLYIPARGDAETAARRLNEAGYRASVGEPLGALPNGTTENRYSVIAHIDAVPSIDTVRKARSLCTALARAYGGEYDGWEAAVAK